MRFKFAASCLESCGGGPTPLVPKAFVYNSVICLLIRETEKPYMLKYELMPGASYRKDGEALLHRLPLVIHIHFKPNFWSVAASQHTDP